MEVIKLFLELTVFPSRVMENLESSVWPVDENIFSHLDGCVSVNGRRKRVLANRQNSARAGCVAQSRRVSRTISRVGDPTLLHCNKNYSSFGGIRQVTAHNIGIAVISAVSLRTTPVLTHFVRRSLSAKLTALVRSTYAIKPKIVSTNTSVVLVQCSYQYWSSVFRYV